MCLFFHPLSPIYISQPLRKKQEFVGKKSTKRNIVGSPSRCLLKSLNYKIKLAIFCCQIKETRYIKKKQDKRTLSYDKCLRCYTSLRIQKVIHDSVCNLQKY